MAQSLDAGRNPPPPCGPATAETPPLVRMTGIERSRIGEAGRDARLRLEFHTLLIVLEGFGTAAIGDGRSPVLPGKCFLLGPHRMVALRNNQPTPLSYCRISFMVLEDEGGIFDRDREIVFEPISRLEDRLRELQGKSAQDELEAFHRHIGFQSLLYEVLRRIPDERSGADNARQAVERTIAYLHRAYREEVEIGRLAQEAKISRWQYGSLFRSLTGETPNRYLNRLRIDQAKRLLAASPSLRVNEIAGQVGYGDEYYFSRRFKQFTGLTPTQYAQTRGGAPRIFSIQYLGELLALGIRPIGTNQAMLHALPEATDDIPAIGEPVDMERLSALRPHLIVYPSFLPREIAEQLSRIAPAVEIDWSADVYTRLRLMGELLNREQEAADWIARYQEKAGRVRKRLQGSIRQGETASAFIYHADGLYVYGRHHFGHTLYEGVGFEPPPGIRALLNADAHAKWRAIPFEALPEYAGDRVFLALADTGIDALRGRQMLEHPAWKSLSAVREGKSYVVRDLWANYNPLTLDRHLDEMVHCLRQAAD